MFKDRGAAGRRDVPGSRSFNRSSATIFVGSKALISRHRNTPGSLVAALDLDPYSVKWPAQDGGIVVVATREHEDFSLRLVRALLDDGAELVVRIFADDGLATWHRRMEVTNTNT